MQSAVASVPTPTGWYVLGHTPARAFDMQRGDDTFLFRAGDMLRFEAISASEFAPLAARAALGEPVARLAE
jgi:allophanate hydrolase subunit 1